MNNTYLFKTTATMKEYNRRKWWIDADIIRNTTIRAETVNAALEVYREMALDRYGITISESALKHKSPMYIDTGIGSKQVGYVITGKTDFDRGDYSGYSSQFIDLWITIQTIVETVF